MAEYTFIVNPAAAKGSGRKAAERLSELLRRHAVVHTMFFTARPGHATELVKSTDSGFVVAVGGDGTINEVANALQNTDRVLGVIPTGSGNDFIKSAGIPRRMENALELILRGRIRRIDAGQVSIGVSANGSITHAPGRMFVNGVGVGFDAAVAYRTTQIRYLSGTSLYLLAVLQTIGGFRPPHFRVRADNASWEGRSLLIATGNGKCAGGGFYLTPNAEIDDGVLDVCAISNVSLLKVLRLIPSVMKRKQIQDMQVKYYQTKKLEIISSGNFTVHADGEIIGRDVQAVKLEVLPGVLQIFG
jgi:YegS/Rv2252/BmrU family lipid kinase